MIVVVDSYGKISIGTKSQTTCSSWIEFKHTRSGIRNLYRKRILHIYGQSRTTERLQHLLERALASCYVDPLSVPGNATYWASASAASGYDKYRKASGRDIEDIPLVEIRNATLLALRQQLSLSVSDLLSQISRLFGFQRRTPKTIQLITRAIEVLEQEGLASRVGDTVIYQSH